MRIMKYVTLAALAAAGLALAGCGGGSKKPAVMGDQQMEMTDAQKAQAAYDAAEAAEMAAMTARTTAKTQLDAAKLANAYDIYTTGGESGVVATNAKVITDAKAAVEKALADVRAEKMKAEEAKKVLDALPADTPGLAAQKEVAASAVEKADEQIKLINGYLTTVIAYAASVDTEAKIKGLAGETPAGAQRSTSNSSGTRVGRNNTARAVLYMLEPLSAEVGTARLMQWTIKRGSDAVSDVVIPTGRVSPDYSDDTSSTNTGRSKASIMYDLHGLPAGVMTWEQIAGAGNLIKKAFGTDNMDVDVLPLAGMPLSSLTGSDGTALEEYPTDISGDQYYKGVKGTLHCQGTCSVDGGNLTGNLFFQWAGEQTEGTRYYRMEAGKTYYTQYGAYARYGYWLEEAAADTRIYLFGHSPAGSAGNITGAASATLPATATYKGKALGLSVLKTYTAGTSTGQKSGQFTADVTLNAKFGAAGTPALGGKIDKFMGNAVGSDWVVTLQEEKSDDFDIENGVAQGSAVPGGTAPRAGVWHANSYGTDTERPVGVFGAFNAHFGTGHAAGAFATRIQAPAE